MRKMLVGVLAWMFLWIVPVLPTFAITYTVTSTADTTDPGTLRTAINNANLNSGADIIQINVSPLSVASSLPSLVDPVSLIGNGSTLTASGDYVLLTLASGSSGSFIWNLVLTNTGNNGTAIRLESNNNVIRSCRVGLDWNNTLSQGFTNGIHVLGQGNLIGGNGLSGQGNLVSRNSDGIRLEGSNNTVCGNVIGLSSDQTTDHGNNNGILIRLSAGNRIGLPVAGWGNVICGNDNYGLGTYMDQGTVIQNNLVGLNDSGTTIANNQGIYLWQAGGDLVGGDSNALQGNVASGNSQSGIYLNGTSCGNTICGNVIGLTADQSQRRANSGRGILLGGSGNMVGLPIAGWGNVVSGNGNYGIEVLSSDQGKVRNNLIGVNSSGTAMGNGLGMRLTSATGNQIGGNGSALEGNCISSNTLGGLRLTGGSTGNIVAGNVVGLTPDQTLARSNSTYGIVSEQVSGNRIGLPVAGWGNVVCGNDNYGIWLLNSTGEKVQNNLVGVNASGTAIDNGYGVHVWGGGGNLVGGDSLALEGNLISGNDSYGIRLANSQGNSVCGNIIGLNAAQTEARANGTNIFLENTAGNRIGLPIAGWGNVIAGGSEYGLHVDTSSGTLIRNNIIGLNSSGAAFGNEFGIFMDAASGNQVGGAANAGRYESNVISDNLTALYLVSSANNTISGNFINTNLAGTAQVVNTGSVLTMDLWGSYGNLIGGLNSDPGNLHANVICGREEGIRFRGSSGGNTLTGNYLGVLANGSLPAQPYTTSVNLTDSSHDNLIGENNGQGNLVAGMATGVVINGAATLNNAVWGNTIAAFSSKGISLETGGNNTKAAPVIQVADGTVIQGVSDAANDRVEVFLAEARPGQAGGSLRYIGAAIANASPTPGWSLSALTVNGEYVCATSSQGMNTSEFSMNVISTGPTATPTATPTNTPLPAGTSTPTPSVLGSRRLLAVPNPGRGLITFQVNTTPSQRLLVRIYNLVGEQVAELQGEPQASQAAWDCRDTAPGVYLAKLWVDGQEWGKLKVAVIQ